MGTTDPCMLQRFVETKAIPLPAYLFRERTAQMAEIHTANANPEMAEASEAEKTPLQRTAS